MKHPPLLNDSDRFHGSLRYYHRSGGQQKQAWDEWIDGKPAGSKGSAKWLKITLIVLVVLALGIIAGLIVAIS